MTARPASSLPEVPLLGVLPGTGGLTRVTDKRHVRHDLADIFCTLNEGVRGQKAKDWRLVDAVVKPAQFAAAVQARALELAQQRSSGRRTGVALTPLQRPSTPRATTTSTSTRHRPRGAHRHGHGARPRGSAAERTSPASQPRG